jgi:ATP-dependent DNA helicase PIF1
MDEDVDTRTDLALQVIRLALDENKNVFMTGPGGTGKSHTIRVVAEECEKRGIKYAITATTGVAAASFVGGKTLHSFSGCGLGQDSKEKLALAVRAPTRKTIKSTKVLIIDEISMLGREFFEKIDYVFKCVRGDHDYAFGGMIIIASGDFLQLPPVKDGYAFESAVWKDLKFNSVIFNKPYRFIDEKYFQMLQRIRYGNPTKNDILRLTYRQHKIYDIFPEDSQIKPTILFPRKADVMKKNLDELKKLPGDDIIFNAKDSVILRREDGGDATLDKLKQEEMFMIHEDKISMHPKDYKELYETICDKEVRLKVGAQVMLTSNIDIENNLINGSRGVIKLINKNGVYVTFLNGKTILIDPVAYDRRIKKNIFIKRHQIPLILGYALSIHKCQGSTLDCAEIDLGPNVFEKSQAYVAISRVRTLEGLFLSNFSPNSIKVDQNALNFARLTEAGHGQGSALDPFKG